MATSKKTLNLVRFSILLALEAAFCFTPLGSIPINPTMVATLMMVPVVVTAIVMGTKWGTLMGFVAGLFSFLVMTFMPTSIMAFVFTPFYSIGEISGNFWSLVICFVPRTLAGTVAGAVFGALRKRFAGKKRAIAYGAAGLLGSMTNTIGVLGGIYLFFGREYAAVAETAYELLLRIIGVTVLTNGVPEAIICTVLAAAICPPLHRMSRIGRGTGMYE